jgi:hypothetical protein
VVDAMLAAMRLWARSKKAFGGGFKGGEAVLRQEPLLANEYTGSSRQEQRYAKPTLIESGDCLGSFDQHRESKAPTESSNQGKRFALKGPIPTAAAVRCGYGSS